MGWDERESANCHHLSLEILKILAGWLLPLPGNCPVGCCGDRRGRTLDYLHNGAVALKISFTRFLQHASHSRSIQTLALERRMFDCHRRTRSSSIQMRPPLWDSNVVDTTFCHSIMQNKTNELGRRRRECFCSCRCLPFCTRKSNIRSATAVKEPAVYQEFRRSNHILNFLDVCCIDFWGEGKRKTKKRNGDEKEIFIYLADGEKISGVVAAASECKSGSCLPNWPL